MVPIPKVRYERGYEVLRERGWDVAFYRRRRAPQKLGCLTTFYAFAERDLRYAKLYITRERFWEKSINFANDTEDHQRTERISPFWVGGYPPFSALILSLVISTKESSIRCHAFLWARTGRRGKCFGIWIIHTSLFVSSVTNSSMFRPPMKGKCIVLWVWTLPTASLQADH